MSRRAWEPWKDDGYPSVYAQKWGDPAKPPETWPPAQLWRMRRAASLLIGSSVVDAACGLGHLAAVLPAKIRYMGVDGSSLMVEAARKAQPARSFLVGDLYEPLPARADTVTCLSTLMHLPDPWFPVLFNLQAAARVAVVVSLVISPSPSLTVHEGGLLYNVKSLERATEELRRVMGRLETWVTAVDGSPGEGFLYARGIQ